MAKMSFVSSDKSRHWALTPKHLTWVPAARSHYGKTFATILHCIHYVIEMRRHYR